MNRTALITALAMLVPASAAAGFGNTTDTVWFRVPGNRVDNIDNHEERLTRSEVRVQDAARTVDERKAAVRQARDDRKVARSMKRNARKRLRHTEKLLRKAERNNGNTRAATAAVIDARKDYLEAQDWLEVKKRTVDARKAHRELDEARLNLTVAQRELRESKLLQRDEAKGRKWHRPKRYQAQVDRLQDAVSDRFSDWRVDRVAVLEARQDHRLSDRVTSMDWSGSPVVASVTTLHPRAHDHAAQQGYVRPDSSSDDALRRVQFDLGEATLDTEALNNLQWNAHVLRENRTAMVRVEGHTDATGPMKMNRELAWDRANTVEDWLQANGVWESQIETTAYGEHRPIDGLRAKAPENRRVELVVTDDPNDTLVSSNVANNRSDERMSRNESN